MNATCQECGASFHTRAPRSAKYCSAGCKWLARKRKDGIPCEVCGEPTGWTRASGRTNVTHKACGRHDCGTIAAYRRGCRCADCRKANAAAMLKYERRVRATKPPLVRECRWCGSEFRPRSNQVLCSPECRSVVFGLRDHVARAIYYGAEYETIDRLAVFERDRWLCGICDLAVDRDARFPDPGAPTLDHIVPISRGGGHVLSNVQLAHFYCNTVKGNRLEIAC